MVRGWWGLIGGELVRGTNGNVTRVDRAKEVGDSSGFGGGGRGYVFLGVVEFKLDKIKYLCPASKASSLS